MKHNYSLIKLSAMIIAMHSMSLIAQNAAKAKLSAFTQQFMHNTNSSSVNKTKGATAVYKKIENGTFLSALIKVTPSANDAQFAALNVKIGTKAGINKIILYQSME
jgi:hypothetical protein